MNTTENTVTTINSAIDTTTTPSYFFDHLDDSVDSAIFAPVAKSIRKAIKKFPAGILDVYLNNRHFKAAIKADNKSTELEKLRAFQESNTAALSEEQRNNLDFRIRLADMRIKCFEAQAERAATLSHKNDLSSLPFDVTVKEAGVDRAAIDEIVDMILDDMGIKKDQRTN